MRLQETFNLASFIAFLIFMIPLSLKKILTEKYFMDIFS